MNDALRWQWFRRIMAMPENDEKDKLLESFGDELSDEPDSYPTEQDIDAAVDAAMSKEKT